MRPPLPVVVCAVVLCRMQLLSGDGRAGSFGEIHRPEKRLCVYSVTSMRTVLFGQCNRQLGILSNQLQRQKQHTLISFYREIKGYISDNFSSA